LGNHYDAFKITTQNISSIQPQREDDSNNKFKILIWNIRSINDTAKKLYLSDILINNYPDIAIILETFLLDEANLYIKNYKTYKTRNINKRKGIAILIHKHILASITQIANDINGRYIKIALINR